MVDVLANAVARSVDAVVRRVVIPVTGAIPWLVEHGVLLASFAALWLAFGAALVASPATLSSAWATIGGLPLPLQALVWLLFLPVMAGLWIWSTDWAMAVRLVLLVGIAAWNLLVFVPRRTASSPAQATS